MHGLRKYFTLDISESPTMNIFFGSCCCLLQASKSILFLLKNLLLFRHVYFGTRALLRLWLLVLLTITG